MIFADEMKVAWEAGHVFQKTQGYLGASLLAQQAKNLPAMWETQVWSLRKEDPLEKGEATHSSILAWRIPWRSPWGSQRVGQDWGNFTFTFKDVLKWLLLIISLKVLAPLYIHRQEWTPEVELEKQRQQALQAWESRKQSYPAGQKRGVTRARISHPRIMFFLPSNRIILFFLATFETRKASAGEQQRTYQPGCGEQLSSVEVMRTGTCRAEHYLCLWWSSGSIAV